MSFDPDAYLATPPVSRFDPDAYLGRDAVPAVAVEEEEDKGPGILTRSGRRARSRMASGDVADKGPGILTRAGRAVADAVGNVVVSEKEYQRRLASGEAQASGIGTQLGKAAAGVVQGSPSMIAEGLGSPEVLNTVGPMAARVAPPIMATMASGPGAPITASSIALTGLAGYVGDVFAQVQENVAGTRSGYSPREALGNAVASPLVASRLPVPTSPVASRLPVAVKAALPRAVAQGAFEGAAMTAGSAAVAGRDLGSEELLASMFLGAGLRGISNEASRRALVQQSRIRAERLGYQGKGTFEDMRQWYRAETAKRTGAAAAEPTPAPAAEPTPAPPARLAQAVEPAPPAAAAPVAPAPRPPAPSLRPLVPVDGPPAGTPAGPSQAAAVPATAAPVAAAAQAADALRFPVVEFPVKDIVINKDVPQFKADADPVSGEVEPLKGSDLRAPDRPDNPITLWDKANGETEVITGRHRLALARRSGEKTIPAQVFKEADGFTRDMAITFDAEANIQDGNGKVKDYAYYFKNSPQLTRNQAEGSRSLLSRPTGQAGWHLGRDAGEGLWSLYANDQIGEAKAVAIARGAPGNEAAQASAIRQVRGKSPAELELYARNLSRLTGTGESAAQLGFEGISQDFASFEAEAAAVAKVQATKIKENSDLIRAAQGAAKRPEAARKMGLPVDDPAALTERINVLRDDNAKLTNPDAETFEVLRREAGLPARKKLTPEEREEARATELAPKPAAGTLFDDSDAFNLASEAEAAPAAPAAAADNTPSMFGDEVRSTPPTEMDKRNEASRMMSVPAGRADAALGPDPLARPRTRAARTVPGRNDLPPFNAETPLLFRADSRSPYVQVPLARLKGIAIVQMPELVRLVQGLTGERPQVKRLARAFGMFRGIGPGRIQIDPRIFRDSSAAAKTLAHEIGHLLAYLLDQSRQRGNILGLLTGMRDYWVSTIPDRPRNPNAALTSKDRAALNRQAALATTAELGPRPPADGPDADPAGHGAWGELRSEKYRDLIESEIATRGLLKADEVRAELIELTEYWKPYQSMAAEGKLPDSYVKYRESSAELYADAISVLLNSPATLKEIAPLFNEAFFAYLRNKPEVFRALLSTWELIGGRQRKVLDLRDEELRAAAKNGEEILRRKAAERQAQAKSWRGWADGLKAEVIDIHHPLGKRETKARAGGRDIPTSRSPEILFEEFAMSDNAPYLYLQRVHGGVVEPLTAAGVSMEDYGLFLFYNRILTEKLPLTPEGFGGGRSMVANPGGTTPETARLGLLNWRINHKLSTFQLMQAADAKFRDLTDQVVRDAVKSGVYSKKTYDELIAPNRDQYAAFAVLDYLSESVPAGIEVGQGTFKDIANSFTATTLKMLSLRRWIQRNDTIRFTTGWMQEFASDEIALAPSRWDGKKQVPEPPPRDSEQVLLEQFEDGKKVGYWVPKDVAKMFEDMSPGRMAAIMRPFNWFFREGVYPMWITFNPYYQLLSGPAKDIRRNVRNMPGASGLRVAGQFVANYGTLLGEAGAGSVRGLGRIPGLGRLRDYRPQVPMTSAARAARAHLAGRPDPLVNEMMANQALGTPMDNFRSDFFSRDDALQVQMERLNLVPKSGKGPRSLTAVLRYFLPAVEYAGLAFEMLAKTAPYQLLRERGSTPREAAHFVRNYVGVPNFRKRGRYTRELNTMLPFFNVFLRGFLSDAEMAARGGGKAGSKPRPAGAGSRTGWWMRYFAGSGFMSVFKALAQLGVLGEGIRRHYERVGDYDMSNFTIVPIGQVDGGEVDGKKTMYIRIPQDETDRLLSAFLYKTIVTIGGGETSGMNLLAFGAGQVPTINPLIAMGQSWGAWAAGYNPRDGLRGSPILSNDVWLEGGWPAFRDMTLYTSQETGVANFFRYDPAANTTLEVGLNAVPGLGRVLKLSDRGLVQKQREAEQEERVAGAKLRNSLPPDVARLRKSYYFLSSLGDSRSIYEEERFIDLSIWIKSVYEPMVAEVEDSGRERLSPEEAHWLRDQSAPFTEFQP